MHFSFKQHCKYSTYKNNYKNKNKNKNFIVQ